MGLFKHWDVGVRIFPGREEIVVGFAAVLKVPLCGIGPRQTELRRRCKDWPVGPSGISDDDFELVDSLGVLSRSQVSLRTIVKDKDIWAFRDWSEQIYGFDRVSSLALDDRKDDREIDLLMVSILWKQPIQFRCHG